MLGELPVKPTPVADVVSKPRFLSPYSRVPRKIEKALIVPEPGLRRIPGNVAPDLPKVFFATNQSVPIPFVPESPGTTESFVDLPRGITLPGMYDLLQ